MSLKQKKALSTAVLIAGTLVCVIGIFARTAWLRIVLMFAGGVGIGAGYVLMCRWYRCPGCGEFLGRNRRPKFCPDCGREIDYDAGSFQ